MVGLWQAPAHSLQMSPPVHHVAFPWCVWGRSGGFSLFIRGMLFSAWTPTILTSSNTKYPLDSHLHDHPTLGLAKEF